MIRKALITGGNRGIGLAIAEGLIQAGFDIWIGSRDFNAGRKTAEDIGARVTQLDLMDPQSIRDAVFEVGDVDVLVNNAGVLFDDCLFNAQAEFEQSMQVMVHAPYALMDAFVPGMVERGYGRIVNLSSDWGSFAKGLNGPGAYGIAKAALNALTLKASRELPDVVKVNAMCPGWVRTRMGGDGADRSPAEGADTAIWLSTLPADGPTGGFFRDHKTLDW